MKCSIEIPRAFDGLFTQARYKIYYGGRGGAKSWSFVRALIAICIKKTTRVLCTREIQNSIEDSVYRLISDTIELLGISHLFEMQKKKIIYKPNGSEFFFEGLSRNINSIKSVEGVDICWVEEAHSISEESWRILIPTIRKDGSEIWISFNPSDINDPTYKRFLVNTPPGSIVKKITWRDNPDFPAVLEYERTRDLATDPDLYAHVWEGEPRKISASQVLNGKWIVDTFDYDETAPTYCGIDFGFANDPTALVSCFIRDNRLYVYREAGGVGVEIDETGRLLDTVLPSKGWPCRADSARPEVISYLNRNGYNLIAAKKGAGSVEDGIAFLRSFDKIVIHSRCKNVAEEARLYSYKIDRLTGDVLPIVIDAHNHYMDALRYAVEGVMRRREITVPDFGADAFGL